MVLPYYWLIHDFLSNRKHKTEVASSYIERINFLEGVSEGLTLRPLQFNIFVVDLFLKIDILSLLMLILPAMQTEKHGM